MLSITQPTASLGVKAQPTWPRFFEGSSPHFLFDSHLVSDLTCFFVVSLTSRFLAADNSKCGSLGQMLASIRILRKLTILIRTSLFPMLPVGLGEA